MRFSEALEHLLTGNAISKEEWGNNQIQLLLRDGLLKIKKADGQVVNLIVSEADILGEDWFVMPGIALPQDLPTATSPSQPTILKVLPPQAVPEE